MASAAELAAMRQAIVLAAHGLGATSPNPPVGCVILNAAGRPVGHGYHRRKGEPHAEVNALAAAGSEAVGGSAVVTLEPCNHQGLTPPCTQALLDAHISRVVIAIIDPTSRGVGGVAVMRASGVTVETGVLEDEALLVAGPWRHSLRTGRPHLTWAHLPEPTNDPALTSDLDRLANTVDVVIREDGRIEEGRPGAHHPDHFRLPAVMPSMPPSEVLAHVLKGGGRAVLLIGDAEPYVAAGLVDRVVTYQPLTTASGNLHDTPFTAPRFRLHAVTRIGSHFRCDARPVVRNCSTPDRSPPAHPTPSD
jgi:diaminohydroxyphosphoribosylaminopyrimidine deaminase / 5-amino-6-(5-phosphoribosylamino)uracil reductase